MPTNKDGQQNEPEVNGAQQQQNTQQQQAQTPESWEAFLKTLPPEARKLYDGHVTGLKNTVNATRDERDALNVQLQSIKKKLGKDPEAAAKELEEISGKLDEANRRLSFLEQAASPEVECRNPKAAYAVATANDLFTRSGMPDWKAIRDTAPELFGKPVANVHAGSGTGSALNDAAGAGEAGAAGTQSGRAVDSFIRRAAGARKIQV